jgi:hypothetical protein
MNDFHRMYQFNDSRPSICPEGYPLPFGCSDFSVAISRKSALPSGEKRSARGSRALMPFFFHEKKDFAF